MGNLRDAAWLGEKMGAIPSQAEYEAHETQDFHAKLREVEQAPLRDRQEACREFADAMANRPEIVAERVGWLLAGSYGYGSYKAALKVAANKRTNRVAWLTQAVGALEWQCPGEMLRRAWNKLTSAQKAALDAAVVEEIDTWESTNDEAIQP